MRRDLHRNPAEDVARSGVTGPQVAVMACLVEHGSTALTELSRRLEMNHGTASGIVDRLQARGLVDRTPDARDRRRTRIAVTTEVAGYVRAVRTGLATPDERRAIADGLRLLRKLLR